MIGNMMKLGEFKFSISTAAYQSLSRSSVFRWQAQERFGQMPAFQYTGLGSDEITLSGDIYPSYAGGIHQIDWMRYYAGQGKPLMMVDGNGYVWGKWVIQSIEENKEIFFDNGVARKQSFNMKISRYVDDIPVGDNSWAKEFKNSMVRMDKPVTDNSWNGEFKNSMVRIK